MQIRKEIEKLTDRELIEMLKSEYLRKLSRYKLADQSFCKKYGLSYEEFERRNIVAEKGYSWEVESDAQEWESANDGIATYLQKLEELKT